MLKLDRQESPYFYASLLKSEANATETLIGNECECGQQVWGEELRGVKNLTVLDRLKLSSGSEILLHQDWCFAPLFNSIGALPSREF